MGLLSKNVLNRIMMIGNLSHLRSRLSTASSIQQTQGRSLDLAILPPPWVGQDEKHNRRFYLLNKGVCSAEEEGQSLSCTVLMDRSEKKL